MASGLNRFLGDSIGRTLVKLAVISFVVGIVMSALNLSPRALFDGIVRFFQRLWNLGFDAIYGSLEYFFLGAAIVVPAFLLIRLLSYRSTPRG